MGRQPLIWIVDDSQTQRAITQHALGGGYRFELFGEGGRVMEEITVAKPLPDLILLDLVMPGLSGDEVCGMIRAQPAARDVPIVMLTASRNETIDLVRAFTSGANDYVVKPFVVEELRARVETLLRAGELKQRAEREQRRIATINQLSRALFGAGTDLNAIVGALASGLVGTLADGCAIVLEGSRGNVRPLARHRTEMGAALLLAAASAQRPRSSDESHEDAMGGAPDFASYARTTGMSALVVREIHGLAKGVVTLSRDGHSEPFDEGDLAAIATCLEITGLAIETAMRSEAERVATRFHQEMIGIVSHDLRSPLNALSMGIEMLRTGAAPQHLDTLRRIDNSTRRMIGIVEQLLDVTRSRIGQGIQVSPTETTVRVLVTGVLEEMRLAQPSLQATLSGDDSPVWWDVDRFQQVMTNLISNAVRYGRPSSPIEIRISIVHDRVTIAVHNELRDAPIPEELRRTIFDPFDRGASGAREHVGGLGLGLYIVREIVIAHGGEIAVESNLDGTTFSVGMPVRVPT